MGPATQKLPEDTKVALREERMDILDAAIVEAQRHFIMDLYACFDVQQLLSSVATQHHQQHQLKATRALAENEMISQAASYEMAQFIGQLPGKDGRLFLDYRHQQGAKLNKLFSESTDRNATVDADRAQMWKVIDGLVSSAPALVLGGDYAKQSKLMRGIGQSSGRIEAFLTIAAAAFPSIFANIENIESLAWLAKVRDFKTLSSDEQKEFLRERSTLIGGNTESEEWARDCDDLLELSKTKLVESLPAGLFTFRNWNKLREMSPEQLKACAATLEVRLHGAKILEFCGGCSWMARYNRDARHAIKFADVGDLLWEEVASADKKIELWETEREKKRLEEKEFEKGLAKAAAEKEAENAARELAQIREFHNRPRSVPIAAESEKLIADFGKCNPGQKLAAQSSKSNFLEAVELLRDSDFFLDYRGRARDKKGDPAIRELADKILSTTNLTIVASALGNDTGKHFKPYFVPERTPVLQSAEELGKLYVESDAVREQVDRIITDPDVAIFVAAAVLPISEVSEFVSFSGTKASAEDKNSRLGEFSERIKNALNHYDEIRTVKSLRVLENGKGSGNKGKTFDTEIPDWVNKTIGDQYTCFADLNNGLVYVYLNEDPEIFFEVPKSELKSEDKFSKFFAQGLAKAYQTKEYGGLLTELKELGFNVEIETEQTKVSYIECGIEEIFSREVSEIKRLRALKEEFEGSQGRAEALKEFAAEVGFRLTETTASGEAQMKLGELAISIPKAITQEISAELKTTITNERNQYNHRQDLAARREANLEKERRRAEQEVKPLEGDKILIVDATVLLMWSAPVPGVQETGRTCLELIKAYASQTGSRIWIPARVLYEVLGDAAFLNSELKLEEVSIRTYPPDTSKPIRAFVEGANHLSMLGSGGVAVSYVAKRGENSNITIVYTDEDKIFFSRAKQAQEAGRQELFAQNEKKRDLGDKAISDILGLCDVTGCQFDVLTGDATYAQGDMPLKSSNGEDVIWKKPFSVVYSVLDFNADSSLDFPSADESKQAIYDWWHTRQEKNRAGGV